MPISHIHKCIFIHIPKCAGTSIESILGMHGDILSIGIKPYLNQTANKENLFGNGTQHFDLKSIAQHIDPQALNAYYKFSFVRNPWDRFISHIAWHGKWYKNLPLTQKEVDLSILQLANFKKDNINNHLRPQWEYIFNDQEQCAIDFVGRFENISEDWEKVSAHIGITKALPQRMSSNHKHYSHYLSDEQAAIIGEFYAKDISLLNYQFERL